MQTTMGQLVTAARMWVGALFLAATPHGQEVEKPFTAVWNSPTKWCETRFGIDMPLTDYSIVENADGDWKGDKMVIFYESELGLYPWLSEDEIPTNGGIPQMADFEAHLVKAVRDIETTIPDKDFSGYAVIDWENWRPTYDRNWGDKRRYQRWSHDKVIREHPDWNATLVEEEARRQFEAAARIIMEGTLQVVKDLRPKGKWGFYGFPACYNYDGEPACGEPVEKVNNQLSWIFEASSAIYPTAYIRQSTVDPRNFVHGHNMEALRVRDLYANSGTPTLLYTRYQRGDAEFYDKEDMDNSLRLSADMGLDGVVLWGSSASSTTKEQCEDLRSHIVQTFGPYIHQLINNAEWCSVGLCNANGRCRHKNPLFSNGFPDTHDVNIDNALRTQDANRIRDIPYRTWRKTLRLHRRLRKLYEEGYSCQCFMGWTGDQCDIPVMF